MANNIDFGAIKSYWGIGVVSNSISWGKSYRDLAENLKSKFNKRVISDGGIVESLECIEIN